MTLGPESNLANLASVIGPSVLFPDDRDQMRGFDSKGGTISRESLRLWNQGRDRIIGESGPVPRRPGGVFTALARPRFFCR
jgi:hypothetical protein